VEGILQAVIGRLVVDGLLGLVLDNITGNGAVLNEVPLALVDVALGVVAALGVASALLSLAQIVAGSLNRVDLDRRGIIRLVLDRYPMFTQDSLYPCDLPAGLSNAVLNRRRRKHLTAMLCCLLHQVGQCPPVGHEQAELPGDGVLVECHSEPLRSILCGLVE
jgi:hypothetical protein